MEPHLAHLLYPQSFELMRQHFEDKKKVEVVKENDMYDDCKCVCVCDEEEEDCECRECRACEERRNLKAAKEEDLGEEEDLSEDLSEDSLEHLIGAYKEYHAELLHHGTCSYSAMLTRHIEDGEKLFAEIERRLLLLTDNGPNEKILQGG